MLSRASLIVRRAGTRSISGAEVVSTGFNPAGIVVSAFAVIAGIYTIDSKNENRMNHLDTKLDTLTQSMNAVAVSVGRIEEQIRKQ
jgi:hypothetical protein